MTCFYYFRLKIYLGFFLVFITISTLAAANKPVFRFVREIGKDHENYMFAQITGIAISNQKEIFVADRKFMTIRKYGWDGKYISKTGQRGKGPGDFLSLSGMQWFNDQLLTYDFYNKRIAITDAEMKRFSYIKLADLSTKLKGGFPIRNTPVALDNDRILAINANYDEEMGRLIFFDRKQNILHHFFCHLPSDIADKKNREFFQILTHPLMGINHSKKQILVSFDYPDREILFYLYDFSGQLIRHFSYTQEKGYRFLVEALDNFSNKPNQFTHVLDIFGYKDYYMVFFVHVNDYNKPIHEIKTNFYFLFFRESGELVYKMPWNVRFLTITPDGYLGGVKEVNEELKVVIYQFDPDALEANVSK